MGSKPTQPWIVLDRVSHLLQMEPAAIIASLSVIVWIVYKLFLSSMHEDRHLLLKGQFRNLFKHNFIWLIFSTGYVAVRFYPLPLSEHFSERLESYLGFLALFSGSVVFVKGCRLLVLEYLFLGHRRTGVPILLVNLVTLLLSIIITGWLAGEIFNIKLAPMLATSAIFSIVLGLALQDTLGNLFAGVALQFDKPYELGDWVEIQGSSPQQRWVGRVQEITWRATVLVGLSDESITIPNRVVGQSEVSNFSRKNMPLLRRLVFPISSSTNPEIVKAVLLKAVLQVNFVRKDPEPLVLLGETRPSCVDYKIIYAIDDYGTQFGIADLVTASVLRELKNSGLSVASEKLLVHHQALNT